MDRNPRHFFVDAVRIEANVDADTDQDFVTIEFAGTVTPTVRGRIKDAFLRGEFEIKIKSLA
jgi:hypothetical protein